MAEPDFAIGQFATGPNLEETLVDPDGNPADLSGSTIEFRMTPRDESMPALVKSASIVGDPTAGNALVAWSPGDLDVSGWYNFQWIVTRGNGQGVPYPADRYRTLYVLRRLV